MSMISYYASLICITVQVFGFCAQFSFFQSNSVLKNYSKCQSLKTYSLEQHIFWNITFHRGYQGKGLQISKVIQPLKTFHFFNHSCNFMIVKSFDTITVSFLKSSSKFLLFFTFWNMSQKVQCYIFFYGCKLWIFVKS